MKVRSNKTSFTIATSAREGSCLVITNKVPFCIRIGDEGMTSIDISLKSKDSVIGVDLFD